MMAAWLKREVANLARFEQTLDLLTTLDSVPRDQFHDLLEANLGEARSVLEPLVEARLETKGSAVVLTNASAEDLMRTLIRKTIAEGSQSHKALRPTGLSQALRQSEQLANARQALIHLAEFLSDLSDEHEVSYEVEIGHTPQVATRFLKDQRHGYYIAYEEMAKGTKDTDLDVKKYDNGTLRSINVTIDDQTAGVISGVLQGVLRTASLFGGFPMTAGESASTQAQAALRPPLAFDEFVVTHELCKPSVMRTLERRGSLQRQLEPTVLEIGKAEKTIKESNTQLAKVNRELAAAKAELATLKKQDPPNPARQQELEKKIKELESRAKALLAGIKTATAKRKQLEAEHASSLKKLRTLQRQLTVASVYTFRLDNGLRQAEIPGDRKAAEEWFVPETLGNYCTTNSKKCYARQTPCPPEEEFCQLPLALRSFVAAYLPPGFTTAHSGTAPATDTLIYREPAQGELMVCKEQACLGGRGEVAVVRTDLVFSRIVDFPQLGVLAKLPLTNRAFENNTLAAQFSPSGSLVSLTYTSSARAAKAAATFDESTAAVSKSMQAKREAEKNRLALAKDEVTAEKDLLAAQLALEQERAKLEAFRRGELPEADDSAQEGGGDDAGQ